MGRNGCWILTPNELVLLFGFQKVSSKLSENYDPKFDHRCYRQADIMDASDFIICPVVCYSNETDKNA